MGSCAEHAPLFGFCVSADGVASFKVAGNDGLHRNPKGPSGSQLRSLLHGQLQAVGSTTQV